MSLLHVNDKPGQFPPSWYAASTPLPEPLPPLRGETRADVCVIGAGYTGLSAALHLAEKGLDVVLVEAQRVGFGASGRNGGQLGSGQRVGQGTLESLMGAPDAQLLWDQAQDAKSLVRDLIERHDIRCHYRPGLVHACLNQRETQAEHASVELLREKFRYEEIAPLDQEALHDICPSPAYVGGSLDLGAGHLHPLAYALGLARAAQAAGVRIYERSEVHRLIQSGHDVTVQTDRGRVRANQAIIATNGYGTGLNRKIAARVMPINNFIIATEPLGTAIPSVLSRDVAVADSKFVVNYFRLSHDGRLLFGGTESYGDRFPRDIAAKVRVPLKKIFPHLAKIRIDYAWGGTLAITMRRLPYLARIAPNLLSASGYSGHGVGNATHAGKLMADALAGEAAGFDVMSRIPTARFPGGPSLRTPLLSLAMSWYALRDRLGV